MMRAFLRLIVVIGAVVLLVITDRSSALADYVFSPYQCSQCPTWTQVPWTFDTSELPYTYSCHLGHGICYYNNIDYTFALGANSYAKQIGFSFTAFETEGMPFDYLEIADVYTLSYNPQFRLGGTPGLGWRDLTANDSVQASPAAIRFVTDGSVTDGGVRIETARVCCQNTAAPPSESSTYYMLPLQRTGGLLLANHDVMYFRDYGTYAGGNNYAMRGPQGADFDLYLRCNAIPTPTQYDYRANSGDADEFLKTATGYCSTGTIWVAVHSFSGSGGFSLVSSPILASQVRSLRAGTNFTATGTELEQYRSALQDASRMFYGATEGQSVITHISVYNSGSCMCGGIPCDVCFFNDPFFGTFNLELVRMELGILNSCYARPDVIAHEWGHGYWNARDEYVWAGSTLYQRCLQSMMRSSGSSPENMNNFCTVHNHGLDRDLGAPFPDFPSVWENVNYQSIWDGYYDPPPRALAIPDKTPDNYDYVDFDFNGWCAAEIVN